MPSLQKPDHFWQHAPFFRLLLPLVTGIVIYDYCGAIVNWYFWIMATGISAAIICTSLYAFRARSFLFISSLQVVFCCIGISCCYLQDARTDKKWFGHYLRAEGFAATIENVPEEKTHTYQLKVRVHHAITTRGIIPVNGYALIYLYKNIRIADLHKGDDLLVPSGWQPIRNAGNPFEFDYRRLAARAQYHYQQFLPVNEIVVISRRYHPSLIERIHEYSMRQLAIFVKDPKALGLLQAMLLGDEINFDTTQRQLYADTGIIHVVAISGGHVAFLFVIISAFFFWIKKQRYQWIRYIVALPVVWLYVLIASAPPSAVRAAVMFSIVSIGIISGKNHYPLNHLFAAAFLILSLQPFWLFSAGFQLSFVAVLSLILFYKRIYNLWIPAHIVARKIWGVAAMSIAAEILVAPLVIFYFHSFPLAFIPANLLAWLLMGVIMCGGMLVILLAGCASIATVLASVISMLVYYFNQLMSYLQYGNPDTFSVLHVTGAELVLVYIMIAGVALFLLRKKAKWVLSVLISFCLFLSSCLHTEWTSLRQQKLVVYNISKTNHVEWINGHTCTIIDTTTKATVEKATREAHIAWQVHEKRMDTGKEWIFMGDKKLLILNHELAMNDTSFIHADYLLLNYPLTSFSGQQLRKIFGFDQLIIGSNQQRYKVNEWKDSCDYYHIPLHATMLQGAIVLE